MAVFFPVLGLDIRCAVLRDFVLQYMFFNATQFEILRCVFLFDFSFTQSAMLRHFDSIHITFPRFAFLFSHQRRFFSLP